MTSEMRGASTSLKNAGRHKLTSFCQASETVGNKFRDNGYSGICRKEQTRLLATKHGRLSIARSAASPHVASTFAYHSTYTQHRRSPLFLSLFSSEVLWPDLSTFPRKEEGRALRPDFANTLYAR